jgi:hypothetical protein
MVDQFAPHELASLKSICANLTAGDEDQVGIDALAAAFSTCPIAERLLERAAVARDALSVSEVLVALGPLGANASALVKLRALFDAYDLEGNGTIQAEDAFSMLKLFQGHMFSDDDLYSLAQTVTGAQGLDFDAFAERVSVEDLLIGMQLGAMPVLPPPRPAPNQALSQAPPTGAGKVTPAT